MIRAFQPHGIIRPIVSDRNYGNTGPAINESRVSAYSRGVSSPTPVNGSPIITMSRDAAGLSDYINQLTPLAKDTALGALAGGIVGALYFPKHSIVGAIGSALAGGFLTSLLVSRFNVQVNDTAARGMGIDPNAGSTKTH